jgi:hypothetical protein
MVALLEDRGDKNLFSVLDDGELHHSRRWTWEERFADFGMTDEVTAQIVRFLPTRQWSLRTADEEEFLVVEDFGLLLARADEPERALMQVFRSQILDGGGFALSLITRDGRGIGFRTSHDEELSLTKRGEICMGDAVIGEYPPEGFDTSDGRPDHMHLFGSVPTVMGMPNVTFHVEHPIPKPWLLALAMTSLMRRSVVPDADRIDA